VGAEPGRLRHDETTHAVQCAKNQGGQPNGQPAQTWANTAIQDGVGRKDRSPADQPASTDAQRPDEYVGGTGAALQSLRHPDDLFSETRRKETGFDSAVRILPNVRPGLHRADGCRQRKLPSHIYQQMDKMNPSLRRTWGWLVLALPLLLSRSSTAAEFDRTHAAFARVLSANVTNATVAYARLKESPAELDSYLEQIAAVPPAEFATWERADRLALLLNLYNAETLRLIRNEYPVKSIRSIGTLPGAAWRRPVVRFGAQIMTLSHLENEIIRKEYSEPRIHFALVCAARGCPPLRSEPFVGARLTEQLNDQARQFLAMPEKNRFEPSTGVLWLSPIFKWYEKDFTGPAGSLKAYVQPYFAADVGTVLGRATGVKVRFTEYDWELNDQPR